MFPPVPFRSLKTKVLPNRAEVPSVHHLGGPLAPVSALQARPDGHGGRDLRPWLRRPASERLHPDRPRGKRGAAAGSEALPYVFSNTELELLF